MPISCRRREFAAEMRILTCHRGIFQHLREEQHTHAHTATQTTPTQSPLPQHQVQLIILRIDQSCTQPPIHSLHTPTTIQPPLQSIMKIISINYLASVGCLALLTGSSSAREQQRMRALRDVGDASMGRHRGRLVEHRRDDRSSHRQNGDSIGGRLVQECKERRRFGEGQ